VEIIASWSCLQSWPLSASSRAPNTSLPNSLALGEDSAEHSTVSVVMRPGLSIRYDHDDIETSEPIGTRARIVEPH
jgi:hypothetical protein